MTDDQPDEYDALWGIDWEHERHDAWGDFCPEGVHQPCGSPVCSCPCHRPTDVPLDPRTGLR